MKKRVTIVVATLLLLISVIVIGRHFDGRLSSTVGMDYMLRAVQTREESEKIGSAIEEWDIFEDCIAERSFPKDMMAELAEAFQNDEIQEFVGSYEAEYKILTQKEIRAYVDLDPVMYKFHETEEAEMKECVWYQLRVEADKMTPNDLVVQDETCSYMFRHGSGGMEKGLPIGGGEVFFVTWDGNNFIISLISYLGKERVTVYFCDGTLIGSEAVVTKMADGKVEISYYRYEIHPVGY